ncbi:MAG: tRNA dihydrouridine(20/20a) synthase DusA, partial [Paracoccaceae bacterium]
GNPHQVTRHMMGLFHGFPGAKAWRQNLSDAPRSNNLDFFDKALVAVRNSATFAAA